MLNIRVLKRVVVNHHHFIVVAFGYREPFVIPVHLMRAKITKRAVGTHFRDRSQEGFSGGFILQGNHQQFIVAMGVFLVAAQCSLKKNWPTALVVYA